jgi:hypothetical protein
MGPEDLEAADRRRQHLEDMLQFATENARREFLRTQPPQKLVVITLVLPCRTDVPAQVIDWMGDNLAEHATHEFGHDYGDHDWFPNYPTTPLVGDALVVSGDVDGTWRQHDEE